jgi:hypothetical protein
MPAAVLRSFQSAVAAFLSSAFILHSHPDRELNNTRVKFSQRI